MAFVLTTLGLGLLAGVLSGIFGIGGGVVIVPGLVLLLGMSQKTATGTSLLALLLPVGVLAVRAYARAGHVDVWAGLLVAAGVFAGSLAGATFALGRSEATLRRLFAVLLVALAVRLFVSG
ncbi:MAG TPA: sulfite exporter TauE/SafE family protein [Mycobacteriales bacterium]|nr:sulfite exporter TauE/SafE family protein [Mycobacteriales bacterium]